MPLVLAGHNQRIDLQRDGDLPVVRPREDYNELARRLGITNEQVISPSFYADHWIRHLEKRVKLDLREAYAAVGMLASAGTVVSMSERVAIPLAALMRLRRVRVPHIVIGHKLSSGLKTFLLKVWPLYKNFSRLVCVSHPQVQYCIQTLRMDPSRVEFIPANIDHRFFLPSSEPPQDFILAVGNEQRDYSTLIQSLEGTGLNLTIIASSPWSSSQIRTSQTPNLTLMKNLSWKDLRAQYARARLVVVPLHPVDYAAGVTSILEGMAMAKPVIASQTSGINGYIIDGHDGIYVPTSDPGQMRRTLLELWENPGKCMQLGADARQAVEDRMNLDLFVERIAQIVNQAE